MELVESFAVVEFDGALWTYAHLHQRVALLPLFNVAEVHLEHINGFIIALDFSTFLLSLSSQHFAFRSPAASDLPFLVSPQVHEGVLLVEAVIVLLGQFLPSSLLVALGFSLLLNFLFVGILPQKAVVLFEKIVVLYTFAGCSLLSH